MMTKHRFGWARLAGGAGAFVILGLTGAVCSSPGVARAERAGGPVILASAGHAPLLLQSAEAGTLANHCDRHQKRGSRLIVCSDEQLRNDPQVRAIVEQAVEAAQGSVDAAPTQIDAAQRAVEEAHAALADAEVQRQLAQMPDVRSEVRQALAASEASRKVMIRDAMRQARAQLANIDLTAIRLAALQSVQETLKVADLAAIDATQRSEIAEALRTARDALNGVDLNEGIRAAQDELDRSIAEAESSE